MWFTTCSQFDHQPVPDCSVDVVGHLWAWFFPTYDIRYITGDYRTIIKQYRNVLPFVKSEHPLKEVALRG